MRIVLVALAVIGAVGGLWWCYRAVGGQSGSGAPPYAEADLQPPRDGADFWWRGWKRPAGPARVGLQVGHWKNDEVPEELHRLEGNTGSSGGGKWEWEVNLKIAQEVRKILAEAGVEVDILPATIPPRYWADVFLAIHADGSPDRSKSGYKLAHPRRDYTGRAERLTEVLYKSYAEVTGLAVDPNVSRNMRGYYAFAWWRYEHAVHPMTTAAIVETGFLTNSGDRKLLIGNPEKAAEGLARGIVEFLREELEWGVLEVLFKVSTFKVETRVVTAAG